MTVVTMGWELALCYCSDQRKVSEVAAIAQFEESSTSRSEESSTAQREESLSEAPL